MISGRRSIRFADSCLCSSVAGILFAVTMMAGVGLTLSTVAVLSILFRERLVHFFDSRPLLFDAISRTIDGVAGIILVAVAFLQLGRT